MTQGSTYLSAILADVGLASDNCPDVVIQTPVKCGTKQQFINTERQIQISRQMTIKCLTGTHRIFRRILFTTSSILAKDWWKYKDGKSGKYKVTLHTLNTFFLNFCICIHLTQSKPTLNINYAVFTDLCLNLCLRYNQFGISMQHIQGWCNPQPKYHAHNTIWWKYLNNYALV